jgi:carboxyl-terminal processing protease
VENDQLVSRGDFIRSAIILLGLENTSVDSSEDLPYRRVAKGLEKYIRIAHKRNALESFGYDLLLAQDITRGQALRVMVNLTGFDTPEPVTFKDVKIGTPDERAVRVAVKKEWMDPIRSNLFGVRRKLSGKDAHSLLRAVTGEEGIKSKVQQNTVPTIQINSSNKRLMNLPKTQILETIWSVIQRDFFYNDKIDPDEAAYKAAEGLIESLGDKYTTFMRPVRSRQFQNQIKGEITGIGAQVEYINGILTIVTPMTGSPAEAAGLEPGDQILKADGEELSNIGFMEAVEKVRGPKGSSVKLTVRRNDIEFVVDVTRNVIRVPEAIITWQGQVVVIKIAQFGRITNDDLRPKIADIMKQDPKGIVLDLRNNPGGLLTAANTVMSIFVPMGSDVVEIRSRSGNRMEKTSFQQITPDTVPMAVLMNEGSASASEIVAGALQDHDRATLIGAKTFGKGTVQQVLQFNDQSSVKMTIAEWYTPLGNKIDGMGVNPDIGLSEVDGRDALMIRALEILR